MKNSLRTRIAAMLLTLVCAFGLLPASALAADTNTLKLERFGMSGVSYESASLGACSLHQMYYDYGGTTTVGFCGTKGGGMGASLIGQTWGNPREITDPTVQAMMAYYYAHSTGVFTDEAKALGVDTIWDAGYTWYMNAWVQAIIWRYQAGTLDNPVVGCAEELMAVYNSLEKTNYTSIDQEKDDSSFRSRAQYILDLGSQVWGNCTVYEYSFNGAGSSTHPASSVQKVVIGELEISSTEEYYSLIVKKVDATNPTKGLSGAEFHIESTNGSYSKDIVTGPDGSYRLDGLTANTYAVTETSSPSGYEIDNAGPEYVVLPGNGSNTVTVTFTDTPIITGSGSIRKVDADDPTKGLAGAVIKIEGVDNNFADEYVTVEGGALADVPWDTMPIGSFTATEVTPPNGYSLSPDPDKVKQEFYWDGKSEVALVFENDARVKIRLLKLDDSNKPLPGAVFNIVKDGQIIGSEKTDAAGSITVSNVTEGLYAFVEVFSPAPFARLTEPVIAYVDQATVDGGGTVTVTAANKKLPSLTILKRDGRDENTVISGTVFEVKGIHTGFHTDVTTGPDGKAILTSIPVDSYEVIEKSVPAPYVVSGEPMQTIWLGPGDDQQLIFNNLKQPLLTIAKTDADDPTVKIPGTVFLVEGIDSDYRDEWTTGDDGTVTKYVAPGSYQITEKSVPTPYYISETESERIQTISLNAGEEKTVSFENRKRPYIEILKENSITHDPIEHVKMQVWYASNNTSTGEYNDLGVFYTDSEGRILLSEPDISLRDGWYRVRELEPAPGFSLPEEDTQEAFVPAGGIHTFRFQDRPLSAICVWKYDSKTGAALSDCWFRVRYLSGNVSGSEGTVIGVYRTSVNGSFTVTGCKAGTYIIEELSSDGTHVIDTPPQTVYLSGQDQDVVHVHFGNAPKGSLLVKKVSTGTKKEPLSDVEFLVTTSDGTLVGDANGKFVTDSSGSFLVENLAPGTVLVVRETRAKPGYLLDDTPQTAEIQAGRTVNLEFRNQPLGNLIIQKYALVGDQKVPLEGALFKVVYSDGSYVDAAGGELSSRGLYYSNADGQIILSGIVGTVVVTEEASVPGYTIDDATRSQTVVVNPNDTQTLYFYNKPEKTLVLQKYIYDGVKNNEPLAGVEFLVTDSTGAYVGPDNGRYVSDSAGRVVITGLTAGMTITAREVSTVAGYVLDGTLQTIEISDDDQVQTLYFYNKRAGGLELIKVNEDKKSERIPDVTFEIRRAGDGGLVDTATTDRTGHFFVPLDEGSYYAVETDCPDTFRLDSTPVYFDVTDGKVTTKTVTNKAVSGIIIHKIDSSSGEGIYGVKFILYDNGKNPIAEGVSDQDGYVYFDELSSESKGRFYLRELEAAPGYTLDTQYKTVYLQPGKTVHIEWENTAVTGQIQIYKYAAEANPVTGDPAGTPLRGAVYEIVNARSGKVVDYITTDARGVAASKPLPLTRYQIREVTAPAYYQIDATVHDVTLEYSGQIIKLAAYDKPSNLKVTITKTGNKQLLAGDSMRYDLTVANNSNVALENFFWHDRFPTDCSTARTVTTGTYNARLNYQITYKTNYNDYRVLATNLLSTNNYAFDLTAIPLMQGEVVTDVRLEFGKVPAGFASVVKPTVTIQTKGTLANGYQVVNRADAGGQYMSQWETGRTAWITLIINLNPPTLPKTGY